MRRTYELNGLDASRIVTCDLMAPELLPELYRRTHLGVFPNRCEGGTNLVLMEYMACGRPVIVSQRSGTSRYGLRDNALLLDELTDFRVVGGDNGSSPAGRSLRWTNSSRAWNGRICTATRYGPWGIGPEKT